MSRKPAEGERIATSGYRHQYLVSADLVIKALSTRRLEWIRVADPEAGRVDDIQIGTTGRVDAYQVKWTQYGGTLTLGDLIGGREPGLVAQLADGWQRLRKLHQHRRVVVHLVTNDRASTSGGHMPPTEDPPSPYHLAAFIQQAWLPAKVTGEVNLAGPWGPIWETLRTASGLSADHFDEFVGDCDLDLGTPVPEDHPDCRAVVDLLFATAAGPERIIQLNQDELLMRLGWKDRYEYRNLHEFPDPPFLYRPIRTTTEELESVLADLEGGYIGVFGSPGSGKSTLLSRTLRGLALRLVPYYAYVPEAQDPTVLRGESTNFLHDVTLRLQAAGFGGGQRPDPSDRSALVNLLHEQLRHLGQDYAENGTKTVILIDGLDHIAREQKPERSLLRDLPLPEAVPDGVFIIVGSQTDELADLPPRIGHVLQATRRRVEIDRLSPSDMDEIAAKALPDLRPEERQRVSQLSDGHPLALIYLLKQLQETQDENVRRLLLTKAVEYKGDIESQYWAHWKAIEDDEDIVHALGLLARVRGPIPLRWVSTWLEERTLRKIQRRFVQYFDEEGEGNWRFFHNSFRLFLERRTANPLPGQTSEQRHCAFHQELADYFKVSSAPWKWETLFHLYSAGEFEAVVSIATFDWFREQLRGLRPLDAIQTDVRLALKAAGQCEDVVAITRLTLVGASLEQRSWVLDDSLLPDLLLQAGEPLKAAEHLRDGNRLRVEPEQALRLSVPMANAGLAKEARRLFELAEPLELLSGRPIPDDHTRPQNLWDLLHAWVRSATFFRSPDDVAKSVRRIRVEPRRGSHRDEEQESQGLQDWLLMQGALACASRRDWTSWQNLYESLEEDRSRRVRFSILLRSAQEAVRQNDGKRSRDLLGRIGNEFHPNSLVAENQSCWVTEAFISMAELVNLVLEDDALAAEWLSEISAVPLEESGIHSEEEPSLAELRFRLAVLRYLLGEERHPGTLRDEDEEATEWGKYVEEEEKNGYRQIALATIYLARLLAWGRQGSYQSPAGFLQQVEWIIDLVGGGWRSSSPSFRMSVAAFRSESVEFMADAAASHGTEVVVGLAQEFERRWMARGEAEYWPSHSQRETIILLTRAGADPSWAKVQLERIESGMLEGLDPHGRVEACQEQARAWLVLGETDAALATLVSMVRVSSGIWSDKDYQLPGWVRWLSRMNRLEPNTAKARSRLMLRRILSVEGSASGVTDAAEELLAVVFQWNPRGAIVLYKELLERHTIGHQGGLSRLLAEAMQRGDAPVRELLHLVDHLLISLVSGAEPKLLQTLVTQVSRSLGRETAHSVSEHLARRVSVDAPLNTRPGWYGGLVAGLRELEYEPTSIGLAPGDLEDRNVGSGTELDRNLYLKDGERLTLDEAIAKVEKPADLRGLLEAEDPENTRYFKWGEFIERIAPRFSSITEVREAEALVRTRLGGDTLRQDELARTFIALSKRSQDLGRRDVARELADDALQKTKASGWDPYFDGGVRHAALQHLIALDPDRARAEVVRLYADDISERFRSPQRILVHLDDVLALLCEEIPLKDIWSEIETYLDELFSGVPLEPYPELEACLEEGHAPSENTPENAVADLYLLYLDHPSHPVAQAAVRATTVSLMDGSQSVSPAMLEALAGTHQAAERALMVLDAVSMEKPEILEPFTEALEAARVSSNFAIRLLASRVHSRLTGSLPTPQQLTKELPPIYKLELPNLAQYDTFDAFEEGETPVALGDPARVLSPFDIELREVARMAGVSKDAVFLRAHHYYQALQSEGTWLSEDSPLNWNRLSAFLRQAGLMFSTNKPHIMPARQALAFVIAELYDGGSLEEDALQALSMMLVRHDPVFILRRPDRRPTFISHTGGFPAEEKTHVRIPDNWIDNCGESLPLLLPRTSDGRVVIAEWSLLRYLEEGWPEEERMSVMRRLPADRLWSGLKPEKGHPPFYEFIRRQSSEYLTLTAPEDHLVIAHKPLDYETPGARWLALNPSIGRALGWRPARNGWFRWVDRRGDIVAESLWWADGPVESNNPFLFTEVGTGWLVLMTERGFDELLQWSPEISRGGQVRRRLGWHGSEGADLAMSILSF